MDDSGIVREVDENNDFIAPINKRLADIKMHYSVRVANGPAQVLSSRLFIKWCQMIHRINAENHKAVRVIQTINHDRDT